MNDLMKHAVAMALALGVSSGAVWGAVVRNVDDSAYVTGGLSAGGYNAVSVNTGGGVYVGGWNNAGTIYQQRSAFKWDISGYPLHVDSAKVTFYVYYSGLRNDLLGDIGISTFTTSSNGAVVLADFGFYGATPATGSKVAFASDTGSTGGQYVTPVDVDVTAWFNTALGNHLTSFCVRLDADYLFTGTNHIVVNTGPVSWIYAADTYYTPTLTTVPEPASLILLGLGALTVIRRRRPSL